MINQIFDDLKSFKPDNKRYNDIEQYIDSVTVSFRHLGNWEDDEEDSYDEEDESWREDNDNQIWARGEYQKYKRLFNEWASKYSWYNKVTLGLDTSEKNWCEFTIEII